MSKSKFMPIIALIAALAGVAALAVMNRTTPAPAIAVSQEITPADYVAQYSQAGTQHLLVDVRTPEEFAEGHLDGAVNISLQTLGERLSEIPTDVPVVLYCRTGNRSGQALDLLNAAGYSNAVNLGGIVDWQAQGYPVTR
jgi:phage shock protein E